MRQVLILGALLAAACAPAPVPPVLDHTTTLNTCANLAPELDALYWKPCMKQAFANIPEGKPVKQMDPPKTRALPSPPVDNGSGDVVRAINNAAFCNGAWSNAWDAATCTSRLNR